MSAMLTARMLRPTAARAMGFVDQPQYFPGTIPAAPLILPL
jgi:hypothetical protein